LTGCPEAFTLRAFSQCSRSGRSCPIAVLARSSQVSCVRGSSAPRVTEPSEVLIDLEFCDEMAAQAFLPKLEQIMRSPQAQTQLVRHSVPRLYAVVTERVPSATG
jgi:hypothetical protein